MVLCSVTQLPSPPPLVLSAAEGFNLDSRLKQKVPSSVSQNHLEIQCQVCFLQLRRYFANNNVDMF